MNAYEDASTTRDGERRRGRAELRNVLAMSIPVVITTSSRALMDIADFIMITWLRVDEAQAAILPAQLVMWSYIVVGLGVVSVVNTFASQSIGRRRPQEGAAYAWQSMYIAVLAGAVGLCLIPALPVLIGWFGHAPAVQRLELAYARPALLTVAPSIAAAGLGWFFVGVHRPWVTMWSVIEANIVNVAVSYVLIFGHLGFAPLGLAGAAWGTLAGVSYRTIRLTLTLVAPKTHCVHASRRQWRPSWRKCRDLVRVGMPCGMHWVSEVVVWTIFINVLIGSEFGTAHLVATNATWQYMRLAFMPSVGVGQALTALVGRSIGAGDAPRAIRETRIAAVLTFAYMGSLSVVYVGFGATLVGWFNSDPEVMEIGRRIMICAAVFQLFDAIGITYNSALRGAGDTFVPSVFFVVSTWLIVVGGGWTAATWFHELGSLGPWIAASAFIVLSGVFLWWRWHGRAWMGIDLFDDGHGPAGDSPPGTAMANAAAASH